MLNVRLKKEGGFTLIELLIVVVIIGILAAVAVPMYSRYITSAKAAEATTNLNALVQYAQGYMQAHPSNYSATGMLLENTATEAGTDEEAWLGEIVADPVYFDYTYTASTRVLLAQGGKTGGDTTFGDTDTLTVTIDPDDDGSISEVTWVGAGALLDVSP